MKKLSDCRLYVITGENYHPGRELLSVMEAAIRGGADIVQLRDKEASEPELLEKARALRELTARFGVLFIVNDYPDIALASEADGVHLGQEDMAIEAARAKLGPHRIIGISTHSIEQARAAERAGADYIGVGPVYPTATKPGRRAVTTSFVAEAAAGIRIPWFAIGGIHAGNAQTVLAAGATRLCAVSAVVGSSDPAAACRELRSIIGTSGSSGALQPQPLGEGTPVTAAGGASAMPAKEAIVNGRTVRTEAVTMLELARELGLEGKQVVAERNGEVVSRAEWAETPLRSGDKIEFAQFVGGG